MTHNKPIPVWQQTNYTGKHELTPKEKAARRRMNIEYIWEYFIDENGYLFEIEDRNVED